jgi:hypothetical protein
MNERRERERFLPEAVTALRVGGVPIRKDFQRNVTMQAGVAGAIDFAHPASTQQLDDFEGP